jgi:hypothetical protein
MVGRDIDVDLIALQTVLLIKPTVVLWGSVPIASLHKGIPQQQREVVMAQTPRAQTAILEGAVSSPPSEIVPQHDSKLSEKDHKGGNQV